MTVESHGNNFSLSSKDSVVMTSIVQIFSDREFAGRVTVADVAENTGLAKEEVTSSFTSLHDKEIIQAEVNDGPEGYNIDNVIKISETALVIQAKKNREEGKKFGNSVR